MPGLCDLESHSIVTPSPKKKPELGWPTLRGPIPLNCGSNDSGQLNGYAGQPASSRSWGSVIFRCKPSVIPWLRLFRHMQATSDHCSPIVTDHLSNSSPTFSFTPTGCSIGSRCKMPPSRFPSLPPGARQKALDLCRQAPLKLLTF